MFLIITVPTIEFARRLIPPRTIRDREGMATHPEDQYLDLVRRVWETGAERGDRTGTGTRALFGETMRFDLSDGSVPLLTTKRIFWKSAVKELIWFLSGDRNIRTLVEQGVHIWTDWPLAKYAAATGETLGREDFEARIISDDAFAAEWAISARCTASSGGTGRSMYRQATACSGGHPMASTRSPRWSTA